MPEAYLLTCLSIGPDVGCTCVNSSLPSSVLVRSAYWVINESRIGTTSTDERIVLMATFKKNLTGDATAKFGFRATDLGYIGQTNASLAVDQLHR